MTEAQAKTGGTAAGITAPFGIGDVANGPLSANAVAETLATATGSWLDWQEECLRFTAQRWQENSDFATSLVGCQGVVEMAAAQQRWVSTSVQAYADEARRMLTIAERSRTATPTR